MQMKYFTFLFNQDENYTMKKLAAILIITLQCLSACAQQTIPLYKDAVPNSIATADEEVVAEDKTVSKVSRPSLSIYLPPKEKANGTAVIICPGGGYGVIVMQHEGSKIAEAFNKRGIAAFVLKYRLPSDKTMKDKSIGPLQDAQQAIKIVREHAAEWNIDTAKTGIMGFSAGGHLASTAATHFNHPVIENNNNINLRPSFAILIYPVISMADSLTHHGSRDNLIGNHPTPQLVRNFSNELQVTEQTPPTYLTHTGDDKVVDVDNSIVFYEALRHHKVEAEMHLYPKGDHGFVLQLPQEEWMQPLFAWMKKNKWVE